MEAQGSRYTSSRTRRAAFPAHLQPKDSPYYLLFIFLITLTLCGWGCGGATGTGSKTAQSSAATASNSTGATGSNGTTGSSGNSSQPASNPSASSSGIGVTPSLASTPASGTVQFTAMVQGTAANLSVTWSALLGKITSSGLYTAPSIAGTDTVTAVSNANTAMSASAAVTITPAAPANAVNLLHFGNAGFGGDDTNVFQTALNSTATNGQTLEIPAGAYNIKPVNFPANSNVFVDAGVVASAIAGYTADQVMLNIDTGPVTITGAGPTVSVFQMPTAQAQSKIDSSQFRHCIEIGQGGAASHVTVSGIACNESGGDGVYIRNATNVLVENCLFNANYRNGGSITGAVNGVTLIGNTFSNNSGTLPKSGVDIEPNAPSDYLENISLQNNIESGNAGDGLEFELEELTSATAPVSITVTGNQTISNGRYGYIGLNNNPTNPTGTILVQNSSSTNDGDFCAIGRFWQAGGELLSFQHLTCTNPHVNGPDPSYGSSAAVGALRGGGATIPMGNISYTGTNISASNGQTTYYFDFEDNSGIGNTNEVFDSLGTMTGATKAPPDGLVQGVATNVID